MSVRFSRNEQVFVSNDVYPDAESSRAAGIAYHLTPGLVWESFNGQDLYQPEAFVDDGFIHLTLGTDPLLAVANMFYTADARKYLVLVLDMNRIQSPVKYEDPGNIYPHIYGLLNTDAVVGELIITRLEEGTFTEIKAA